ncbi:N-acetyltransferase 8-like 2 [Sphaeramia orbicularis]|uniref:N-acetyltransferase 8-like 2 n=1 Tax=Sphaeramia orbicularis TaxID=375764 RepID=UPI00117E4153|nr:probable N-acetyltransferase camello [Sphaeramia orbicularis]
MQVVIRQYRPSDKDPVLNLFSIGIKEHIGPCFYNAMTSPLYLVITMALCVAGYLLGSLLGAVVLPGVWAGSVYYSCHEIYSGYVRRRIQTEMQDIPGNFLSRPDDCFWVAEVEVDGRPQILGMVAVVAQQNGQERFGELFRMIISPTCRRIGLGLRLTQTVLDHGKERGFSKVVLETSCTQRAAVALYEKAGFNLIVTHTKSEAAHWMVTLARVTILKMEKYM